MIKVSLIDGLNDPFEISPYFSKENRKHYERFLEIRQSFSNKYGIICFSSNWNDPVLWGHYGDKHRGTVLGLEVLRHELIFIEYQKQRVEIRFSDLNTKNEMEIIGQLINFKYDSWKYENEVRIIVNLSDCTIVSDNYFIPFKENFRISEVILGSHFDNNEEQMATLSEEYGARIIPTKLAFRSFNIVEDAKKKVKLNANKNKRHNEENKT